MIVERSCQIVAIVYQKKGMQSVEKKKQYMFATNAFHFMNRTCNNIKKTI